MNLHQLLVEQSPDALIFADREGVIRLWNARAEALFGYSAQEALGQSLDLIIPEHLRERHWQGYRRAMAEGRTRLGDTAMLTRAAPKDGGKVYVELAFGVLTDPAGGVLGALATGRRAAKP